MAAQSRWDRRLDSPSNRGDAVRLWAIVPPLAAAGLGEATPFLSLVTQPEPSSDQLIPVKVDCIGNPKARLSADGIALLEANQFSEFDSTILQKSDQYPPARHAVVKRLAIANWIKSHFRIAIAISSRTKATYFRFHPNPIAKSAEVRALLVENFRKARTKNVDLVPAVWEIPSPNHQH
jgi:hypothetical protein